MDERQLRAFHRAVQPILQRTAPTPAQTDATVTPPVLDQVAWGVVLAYVANVSRRPPEGIPGWVQAGEGPLPDAVVRSALGELQRTDVRLRLEPAGQGKERFVAAAHRLLEAYGWVPQRAAQAADEMAGALQAAIGRRR